MQSECALPVARVFRTVCSILIRCDAQPDRRVEWVPFQRQHLVPYTYPPCNAALYTPCSFLAASTASRIAGAPAAASAMSKQCCAASRSPQARCSSAIAQRNELLSRTLAGQSRSASSRSCRAAALSPLLVHGVREGQGIRLVRAWERE